MLPKNLKKREPRALGAVVLLLAGLVGLSACSPAPVSAPRTPEVRPPAARPPADAAPVRTPKSYKVAGQWYHPLAHAGGFRQQGLASWYGRQFHGRPTSSGEIYDMHAVSAAHKTLPLGTRVRVHNLENDRRLDVRINDRGPFVQGRIIDLSYAAAQKLGVVGPGTAKVQIAALGSEGRSAGSAAVDYYRGRFTFQVGAFRDPANARRLRAKLGTRFENAHVKAYRSPRLGRLYGVRVGLCDHLDKAEAFKLELRRQGYPDAFTVAQD